MNIKKKLFGKKSNLTLEEEPEAPEDKKDDFLESNFTKL